MVVLIISDIVRIAITMNILVSLWSVPDGTLVDTMAREVVPHPCWSCNDDDHHDNNDDDDDDDDCWEGNTVVVFRCINVHTVLPLVGKIIMMVGKISMLAKIMMVGKIMMVVKIIRCHR